MSLRERLPLGVTAVMLPELDFDEQVRLCVELGVTHYVFRPREIPDGQRGEAYSNWGNHRFDLPPQRLAAEGEALGERLREAGMTAWCTVPRADAGDDEATLDLHLRGAAAAGCASIRLSPKGYPGGVFDFGDYLTQAIADYRRVVAQAQSHGLKVVIEMHAGNAACAPGLARSIVETFDPSDLGIILDLPNLAREGAVSPGLGVSVIEPWLDHCHVGGCRRVAGEPDDLGFRQTGSEMCALSECDLDIPAWFACLAATGRTAPLVIEDYSPGLSGESRLRRSVDEIGRLLEAMEEAPTP